MAKQRAISLSEALSQKGRLDPDPEPRAAVADKVPEFEIEINQIVVVRKIDSLVQAWCAGCVAEGQWVTPEHAAIISNSDTRSIYRRVEAGAVHFLERTDYPPLVCLNSLFG